MVQSRLSFPGGSNGLLLKRINWATVNRATRRQVRNREQYCPPVSLFRWWARRPHALVGALLDGSRLSAGERVSDPFSGGGTVAVEAAVRGFKVYAQDLNPWATWGLATALDGVNVESLKAGIDTFVEALSSINHEYVGTCPTHGPSELAHVFWVRRCECDACGKETFLYPYSLITVGSRLVKETHGYYGCSACGSVTRCRLQASRRKCRSCGTALKDARQPLLAKRRVLCAHCEAEIPYAMAWSRPPQWHPVLVQRVCRDGKNSRHHFDWPTEIEVMRGRRRNVPTALREAIPKGLETRVLRRAGFRLWSDLYPARQLTVLLRAAHLADDIDVDERVRGRLQLAVAGAGEMAGFLCRWDRFHPKTFEALANHRFSSLGVAVETNPLSTLGRGTIPRRLMASLKAARWTHDKQTPRARWMIGPRGEPALPRRRGALVVTGSSASQELSDRSTKLVITDPPYYDAVQYRELSWLFLTWAKVVTGRTARWRLSARDEAVPNASRGTGAAQYEQLLRRILTETARTLHPQGTLLLTYHSTDFRGWAALGRALHAAGFHVAALGVAHSENEKDHPKRNRLSFIRDLVIECQKGRPSAKLPAVVTTPRKSDERELIAAGRTIAQLGHADPKVIGTAFLEATARLRQRRIHVPQVLRSK